MKDEALKLALEALEEAWYHVGTFQPTEKAIDLYDKARAAIKEALAQPVQEPVAWMNDSTPSGIFARHIDGARNFGCTIPLYITPPQRTWVELTDEEILEVWKENEKAYPMDRSRLLDRTRACIKKAQEK